jgi:hypothetical protein
MGPFSPWNPICLMSHGSQIPIFTMLELNPRSFSVFLGSKCQSQVRPENPHGIPMNAQREPPKKPVETPQDWSGRASSMQRIGCQRCCVQLVPIHFRRLGRFWTGRAGMSENHGKTMGKYGTIHDTVRVYSWENHRTKWWILQLTMFDYRYLMICHEVRSLSNRSSQ